MKKCSISLVALGLLVLSGCGGGDSHEAVMNDTVSAMNSVADAVESIEDEASAKAAITKIKAQLSTMEAIKKRAKGMSDPSEDVQKKLLADFMPKMMKVQQRLMKAAPKLIKYPDVAKALQDFQKLSK